MADLVERLRAIAPLLTRTQQVIVCDAAVEIDRLRAGGCARNQKTTQFCAEAATLRAELDFCRSRLAIHERHKGGAR